MLKIKKQKLEINGIESLASHGVYDFEKSTKNKFITSVSIYGDFSKSMSSDNLTDTLDYTLISNIVSEEMLVTSDLIEHVCFRISDRISKLAFDISKIIVKIEKIAPPLETKVEKTSFELVYEVA